MARLRLSLWLWIVAALMALGLSAFWYGFWSGVMYAASFVLIQMLHFTLATKQPAMTAPAMAAKLKDISDSQALQAFVDEVTHLVRSQMAAILGNVVLVFPVTVLLSTAMVLTTGAPMLTPEKADYVLHSLTLLGPSLLFAAFTGVLLFSSSIVAGWVENWFVLHRLDSAIRYNPRITAWLGALRADRWAQFMRHNISGLAANISLGMMLGLVPAILAFLGPALDVRHVTLSAGQLGAACAALGWEVVRSPALWWAAASIPLIGLLGWQLKHQADLSLQARHPARPRRPSPPCPPTCRIYPRSRSPRRAGRAARGSRRRRRRCRTPCAALRREPSRRRDRTR